MWCFEVFWAFNGTTIVVVVLLAISCYLYYFITGTVCIQHIKVTSYWIMSTVASQIIGVSIVYSTVCSGLDKKKHQRYASLAFVRGIHRWPVHSPYKGAVTRKMFPFDDIIMIRGTWGTDRSLPTFRKQHIHMYMRTVLFLDFVRCYDTLYFLQSNGHHIEAEKKWRHFRMHLLGCKCMNFD